LGNNYISGNTWESGRRVTGTRYKNKSYYKAFAISPDLKRKRNKNKIYVVLGKYDKIVNFSNAYKFWKGYNLKVFNAGHPTMVFKIKKVKNILLQQLKQTR